jgi:hypothetical protein
MFDVMNRYEVIYFDNVSGSHVVIEAERGACLDMVYQVWRACNAFGSSRYKWVSPLFVDHFEAVCSEDPVFFRYSINPVLPF